MRGITSEDRAPQLGVALSDVISEEPSNDNQVDLPLDGDHEVRVNCDLTQWTACDLMIASSSLGLTLISKTRPSAIMGRQAATLHQHLEMFRSGHMQQAAILSTSFIHI